MVDRDGERFTDEAASHVDRGHDRYQRHTPVPAIPAWMVFDSRQHRRHPPGRAFPPGLTPKWAVESGFLRRAETVQALAERRGIDPAGLRRTVHLFNGVASTGRDQDCGRSDSAYDRCCGDPCVRPNPT